MPSRPDLRAIATNVREAFADADRETLLDILTFVLKEYVVEGPPPMLIHQAETLSDLRSATFAQLVAHEKCVSVSWTAAGSAAPRRFRTPEPDGNPKPHPPPESGVAAPAFATLRRGRPALPPHSAAFPGARLWSQT